MLFFYNRISVIALLLSIALVLSNGYGAASVWFLFVFKSGMPVTLVDPAATCTGSVASGLAGVFGYLGVLSALCSTGLVFLITAQVAPLSPLAAFLAAPLDFYYTVVLWVGGWYYSIATFFEFLQISAIGATMLLCLKCLFVFLLIVLVRVTTPKFKLETITKLGWLYSLSMLFSVFFSYWTGFFLF